MNIWDIFDHLGLQTDSEDPYSFIDYLIHNSTLDPEVLAEMEDFNHQDTAPEVFELMLDQLIKHQKHPVTELGNPRQKDINKFLDRK